MSDLDINPATQRGGSSLTRREAIGTAMVSTMAAGTWTASRQTATASSLQATPKAAGGPGSDFAGLLVRKKDPLNAETPGEALTSFLTPVESLFVRAHYAPPRSTENWTLRVEGLVDQAKTFTLDQLAAMGTETVVAVLQCSGNGRGYFEPAVGGVSWMRGAVGNAEWTGVPLRRVLEAVGVREEARHIQMFGADDPIVEGDPPFHRSLPMAKAQSAETMLVFQVNGEPLPRIHGGPLRMGVPGWAGNHWIKWLTRIQVSAEPTRGYYMDQKYRVPETEVEPGAEVDPATMRGITTLPVKSLFALPATGSRVEPGQYDVRGVAWSGLGTITRVEVALDDPGAWQEAELITLPESIAPDQARYTWRPFRFGFEARGPIHRLRVRAFDTTGATQPERTPWNPNGYTWNGIDSVEIRVDL